MQQQVVALPRQGKGPEGGALNPHGVRIRWRQAGRPPNHDPGDTQPAVDLRRNVAVADAIGLYPTLDLRQRDTAAGRRPPPPGSQRHRPLGNGLLEQGVRCDLVDQPPSHRPLAAHTFFGGAENIGQVAAHPAFIDQTGKPTGSRQHRQERDLGQRNRRAAIVDKKDVIGRQGQFVAATGCCTIHRAKVSLPRFGTRFLDAIAGLVGELAEVDLMPMASPAQHTDVGAGTKDPFLAGADNHHGDLRMLEAQPLHRIGQLDMDPKIVGVELQLITCEQAAFLRDVEGQVGTVSVYPDTPVAIAAWIGAKIDRGHSLSFHRTGIIVLVLAAIKSHHAQSCRSKGGGSAECGRPPAPGSRSARKPPVAIRQDAKARPM